MTKEQLASIAIVIPVHNRKDETLNCLHHLQLIERTGMDITVVVVDDGSSDGTSKAISAAFPETVVLQGNGNLWWSGATNVGVKYAMNHDFHYVLTLNDDVGFNRDFLIELFKTSKTNGNAIACGVVCSVQDNKIISAGKYPGGILKANYIPYLNGYDVSYLPRKEYRKGIGCGHAVLIPIDAFKEIGLFDDAKFPHHMGDMDFMIKAKKKGFDIVLNPKVLIYATIGDNYFRRQLVYGSLWNNVKMFFNIKSTANLRTRWFFYSRHTPYYLGFLAFISFLLKMIVALGMKLVMKKDRMEKVFVKKTTN